LRPGNGPPLPSRSDPLSPLWSCPDGLRNLYAGKDIDNHRDEPKNCYIYEAPLRSTTTILHFVQVPMVPYTAPDPSLDSEYKELNIAT